VDFGPEGEGGADLDADVAAIVAADEAAVITA